MKDILTSPRAIEIRHNRRIHLMRRIVLFFIFFIVVIGATSFFSNNKNIIINEIQVTGTQIIDKEEVSRFIQQSISGKYIHLFSKSNSFIYPQNKIYKSLLLNFPRIEKLSIYRKNLNTLHIDISERIGSHLYCGSSVPEGENNVGENCYYINNDGFIFDQAPYFSGNVYFKYYGLLDTEVKNPLGQQMMNIDNFHKLARFIDTIESFGFDPIYIVADKDNTSYLYLGHSKGSIVPKIIFKNDNNLNEIEENLSLSMQKEEFREEINQKYDKLLYIDLRFKNKVLYNFQ